MTRRLSAARLAAGAVVLAVPLLLGACSSGGGGGSLPTIPPPTPVSSVASAAPTHPGPTYPPGCPTSQPAPLAAGEKHTVTIETTLGNIEMEIDSTLSPIATGNFVALAECGYYDGVVFHRIVPGFVIQGGDGEFGRTPDVIPDLLGSGGPPYRIKDEPVTTTYKRGTVAMARTAAPDSAGSQFFIVLDDAAAASLANPQYNNYQIMGTVTKGMDVVDAITAAASGLEKPASPVVMTKVSVTNP